MSINLRKFMSVFMLGATCLFSAAAFSEAPMEVKGAMTVDLEEAKYLHEKGAVFIDVRDRSEWSTGHITGSVNLDFDAEEFTVLYLSPDLDRSTPIVFYTSSSLNVRSAMASFFAHNWGYTNVFYFRDGFYSWMAADMPVELKLASSNLQQPATAKVEPLKTDTTKLAAAAP